MKTLPLFRTSSLVRARPDSECRAIIVVPVRNEESRLVDCLTALSNQHYPFTGPIEHRSYEILVLCNNCTDDSLRVAEESCERWPQIQLHVASRTFPKKQAHAGTARRLLMEEAKNRLLSVGRVDGLILSTDADSVVAPDWLYQNMLEVERGAEAVGGAIELDAVERSSLEPEVLGAYFRDKEYRLLVAHLECLLDPVPWDTWPRHHQHFGASVAVTVAAYERCGGMPAAAELEDVAFFRALQKADVRFRHSPNVRVTTAARLEGRATIGFAQQLRYWRERGLQSQAQLVESGKFVAGLFRDRATLRHLWCQSRLKGAVPSSAMRWMTEKLSVSVAIVTDRLNSCGTFGQFLEELRFEELHRAEWQHSRCLTEIREANCEIRQLLSILRRAPLRSVLADTSHSAGAPVHLSAYSRDHGGRM